MTELRANDYLIERIESRDAVVAVVGLGYVGLPVAASFAEAGFRVLGIDLSSEKVREVKAGRSPLRDVPAERLSPLVKSGSLKVASTFRSVAEADAVLICVPTPITDGQPDLSRVIAAGRSIGKVLREGSLVVLESTTYPGSTEELLAPLLEAGVKRAGADFHLAYSPERIDPGNDLYSFSDIPKIVGGIDEPSTRAAAALYGQVVPKVITVSGTREAELAKLIENTYRHVNIALVNELAIYAHEMNIDIWEAIGAAGTKPFGFTAFWPGPGWGGHCIPLDPAYLSWRVRRDRAHEIRFVEVAQAVNSEMPRFVAERVSLLLNDIGKSVRDARVLGIGASYKAGTEDTREAGAIKVLNRLASRGARVSYHDPLVPTLELGAATLSSVDLNAETLAAQDVVVALVPQVGVDWGLIAAHAPLVLDCCNAFGFKSETVKRL
ncbi:MAG: nucleotide sugar dehydrogenase [Actinomycetota bacterium]|nr:nucleotide sugar dehydrogenase [Actinomycetota bacterium]